MLTKSQCKGTGTKRTMFCWFAAIFCGILFLGYCLDARHTSMLCELCTSAVSPLCSVSGYNDLWLGQTSK